MALPVKRPIHDIARYGRPFELKQFLTRNNMSKLDSENRNPLHYAARFNSYEMVKILIEYGAPIDARDNFDLTPIQCAILNTTPDRERIIQLLVDSGANVDVLEQLGQNQYRTTSRSPDYDFSDFESMHFLNYNVEERDCSSPLRNNTDLIFRNNTDLILRNNTLARSNSQNFQTNQTNQINQIIHTNPNRRLDLQRFFSQVIDFIRIFLAGVWGAINLLPAIYAIYTIPKLKKHLYNIWKPSILFLIIIAFIARYVLWWAVLWLFTYSDDWSLIATTQYIHPQTLTIYNVTIKLFMILFHYPIYPVLTFLHSEEHSKIMSRLAESHNPFSFDNLTQRIHIVMAIMAAPLQLAIMNYIPYIGSYMAMIWSCWFHSFYVFSVIWSHVGMSPRMHYERIGRYWVYFLGFGAPLAYISSLNWWIGDGLYMIQYPLVLISVLSTSNYDTPPHSYLLATTHPIYFRSRIRINIFKEIRILILVFLNIADWLISKLTNKISEYKNINSQSSTATSIEQENGNFGAGG